VRLDHLGQARRLGGDGEEARLLRHRVDEQRALRGQDRGERDGRVAAAAAEVEEPVDAARPERDEPGQAVDDMGPGDACRIADRGQVDRAGPRQEESSVIVDGPASARVERQAELIEPLIEGGLVLGWQRGEGVDARRERLTLVVQGPPPSLRVPSVRVAPLPASSSCAPR